MRAWALAETVESEREQNVENDRGWMIAKRIKITWKLLINGIHIFGAIYFVISFKIELAQLNQHFHLLNAIKIDLWNNGTENKWDSFVAIKYIVDILGDESNYTYF